MPHRTGRIHPLTAGDLRVVALAAPAYHVARSGPAVADPAEEARPPLLPLALRRARLRFAVGLALVLTLPLWLPSDPSSRIWTLTAVALLAPWLVLGRDARSNAEGWRGALCGAPRAGRLVLLELVPPLAVVAMGAIIGTGGLGAPALTVFAWAAALVCVTDALDRRLGRPGPAWVGVLVGALAVLTAPLWLAPVFGGAGAPWVATLAIGLHPAAATLAAAGQSTLQDPVFYTWTLSGVIEVRPIGWLAGASLFLIAAVLGAARAVRAIRRPPTAAPTPLGSHS